jgi:tripartite-type tricarboxylate transporter receptor subunit TctC
MKIMWIAMKFALVVFTIGIAISATCTVAVAASSFPTKDIEMIIPYTAGGGFDIQARIVARYIPKYLPKTVTVIPVNVPGVANIAGSTQLYASRPDGYTIGIVSIGDSYYTEYLSPEPVAYKTADFVYIGTWTTDTRAIGFTDNIKAKTWDELVAESKDKPILFGSGGRGGAQHNDPMIVGMYTDANFAFVHYEGSGQIVPALGRGEVSGHMGSVSTIARQVDQGIGHFFCVMADKRDPDFPDVPTALEVGMPKDQYEKIMTMPFFGTARMMLAPPKIDPEVVRILREAFWKAIYDPDLIKEFKTAQAQHNPINGEETQTMVEERVKMLATYPELIKELREEVDK